MFCAKCGAQIADDAAFCFKCGNKAAQTAEIVAVQKGELEVEDHTTAEIKEYLGYAKTLEVNRHTLIATRDRLQQIINTLGHSKTFSRPIFHASEGFDGFWSIFWKVFVAGLVVCLFACGDASDAFLANLISIITVALIFFNPDLLAGIGITLAVSAAVSLTICIIRSCAYRISYNAKVRAHNRLVDDDKKRVAREKEQIRALQRQQAELGLEIQKVDAVLKKLYALDFIHPDFRGLVPVVTMYGYFDSRRCFTLIGPNGAYNLWAQELRDNIIIENLNHVVSMLSRIERNQHALYAALQESNSYAERMCNQANSMIRSMKAIEHNSEIAAYNAKIAAENSTISAYIDVYHL